MELCILNCPRQVMSLYIINNNLKPGVFFRQLVATRDLGALRLSFACTSFLEPRKYIRLLSVP